MTDIPILDYTIPFLLTLALPPLAGLALWCLWRPVDAFWGYIECRHARRQLNAPDGAQPEDTV